MGTPRIGGFGGGEHHAFAGCQATSKTGPPATSKTGPPRRCRDVHGVASGWFAVVGSAREERRPEEPRKSPLRRFSRGREGHPGRPECVVRPPPAGGRKGPRVRGGSPLGRRSAFPCLRAALPGGVCAERSATPPLGHAPLAASAPPEAQRAAVPAPTGRTGRRSALPAVPAASARVGSASPEALRAAVPTGGRSSKRSPTILGEQRLCRPRPCGPLCRPEVGVPSGPRVLLLRAVMRRLRRCAPRCRPRSTVPGAASAPPAALRAAVPAPTGRTGQRSAFQAVPAILR